MKQPTPQTKTPQTKNKKQHKTTMKKKHKTMKKKNGKGNKKMGGKKHKNTTTKSIKKKQQQQTKQSSALMITENCSPFINHVYPTIVPSTCFTDPSLFQLRDMWNTRHPDVTIDHTNGNDIWNSLRENMKKTCNRESCWLKQGFIDKEVSNDLLETHFAPNAPKEWKKNPREWLSSVEITDVMKQYEKAFPEFEFIGPSPINFEQRYKDDNTCVWEELCDFQLANYIRQSKHKIGIIFNTDPDYKDGSHWIALFIDIKRKLIYYFDSNGNQEPGEVHDFIKKVTKQGNELGLSFTRDSNHPFRHQEEDGECGMYCLYFIIELLTNNKEVEYFKNNKIADHCMRKMRKIYFNM